MRKFWLRGLVRARDWLTDHEHWRHHDNWDDRQLKSGGSWSTRSAVLICSIYCSVKCKTRRFVFFDGANSLRAYEQLMRLEIEFKQNRMVYKCPAGHHDDLAMSCAMLVWAAQHPHLPKVVLGFGAASVRSKRPAPSAQSMDVTVVWGPVRASRIICAVLEIPLPAEEFTVSRRNGRAIFMLLLVGLLPV